MEAKIDEILSIVRNLKAGQSAGGGDDGNESEDYPAVQDYDEKFTSKLKASLEEAKKVDPELVELTQVAINASNAVRRLILIGQRNAKPTSGNPFQYLVGATDAGLKWVKDHFKTKFVNHSKTLNELMGLLTWPTIGPSAENYVIEMTGSLQCYTNKIVMEFRGKDEKHTKWAQNIVAACKILPEYINDHQKGGIKWNNRGSPAKLESLAPTGGSAVVAPAASSSAPAVQAKVQTTAPKAGAASAQKKTPSVGRVGDNRVEVKYYENGQPSLPPLKIEDIVSFIGCKGSTFEVKGKVKAISLLQCEKCDLIPNDVIGMIELTNSKGIKVWFEGNVKSVSCDKCDSVELYLNQSSKDVTVMSSFSGSVNLEYPDPKDKGNYIESPIPEQIKAHFDSKGKLISEVYVHE